MKRLYRELELWGPIDSIGEAWPFDHPCPCCGEPGPHEPLRRLRLLSPIIIRRMKQEGVDGAPALDAIANLLCQVRKWFQGDRFCEWDRSCNSLAAVCGPDGSRFARDLDRIRPDLEAVLAWVAEAAPEVRAPDPDATVEEWRDYLRIVARAKPRVDWDRSRPESYLDGEKSEPRESPFFRGHPLVENARGAARDVLITALLSGSASAIAAAREVAAEIVN